MPLEWHESQSSTLVIKDRAIHTEGMGRSALVNALRLMRVSISFSLAAGVIGADLMIEPKRGSPQFFGMASDTEPPSLSLFQARESNQAPLTYRDLIRANQAFIEGRWRHVEEMLETTISDFITQSVLNEYPDSDLMVVESARKKEGDPLRLVFRILSSKSMRLAAFRFEIPYEQAVRLFGAND